MPSIESNPIYKLFQEALAEGEPKQPVSLQPTPDEDKRTWNLPLRFSDGSIIWRKTGLPINEFMDAWRSFCQWFNRVRQIELHDAKQHH